MLKIKKRSGWSFETSSSTSASIEIVLAIGAGKGSITLKPPGGGSIKYQYAAAGAGFGLGAKLTLGSSSEENLSGGYIYILDSFRGTELQLSDMVGGCLIAELSGGPLTDKGHGGSATAMLLGIDPMGLNDELMSDIGQLLIAMGGGPLALDFADHQGWFQSSAKAVLFMAGINQGTNVGAGALGSMGYLWVGEVKPDTMRDFVPAETETIHVARRNIGYEAARPITLSDALFDFDRFNIKPVAERELQSAGSALRSYRGRRIIVQGFTDSIGPFWYNQKLSEKRATAVKNWLVARGYIKESDVKVEGYGPEYPVAPNNDPIGRKKNRRVEIHIRP